MVVRVVIVVAVGGGIGAGKWVDVVVVVVGVSGEDVASWSCDDCSPRDCLKLSRLLSPPSILLLPSRS